MQLKKRSWWATLRRERQSQRWRMLCWNGFWIWPSPKLCNCLNALHRSWMTYSSLLQTKIPLHNLMTFLTRSLGLRCCSLSSSFSLLLLSAANNETCTKIASFLCFTFLIFYLFGFCFLVNYFLFPFGETSVVSIGNMLLSNFGGLRNKLVWLKQMVV